MNYLAFSTLYDELMADAPYEKWFQFVCRSLGQESLKDMSILDVGCGTGELLIRFLKAGAVATGVDLSTEMLMVAKEKAEKMNLNPLLIEQDMSTMDKLGEYHVVTVFCDSLNYLQEEEEVKKTFASIYRQLKADGLFLFDVHSPYKVNHVYLQQTFADAGEDISYIWNSFSGEVQNSVEHELTFFVLTEDGKYDRFEELHKQRTYDWQTYQKWLVQTGFVVEQITADFDESAPTDKSERIFFKARKK
ncbi:methyltransferase [Alkalihalobacillus alcalophilus ATCC 27647 = CGMCC 1.3604]|uniref:Methyltransferase n=1 Tax=Alkalihalobacillus alcalophilus ATCC 27647 = CGMCC 1.3604 TaxID=1218173 RepID=A0A4S4JWA6_ALKAL|nr:class I SAM-dependent methyltransferase [Alkalihalobacillus alcalophilus]MED1563350.1 class I SAM-dependent methyltransferase [Alkalihalobacillus alcalophilus]THG88537.1 methyltransferase [Alkalihalobacillus alcalophilus ATCC 27647 = CGMCC 1.3604]